MLVGPRNGLVIRLFFVSFLDFVGDSLLARLIQGGARFPGVGAVGPQRGRGTTSARACRHPEWYRDQILHPLFSDVVRT